MFKHLHLEPPKHGCGFRIDSPHFEEFKLDLSGKEEGVDSLDTLMYYVQMSLGLDTPEEKLYPLSTWQDTKAASPPSPSPTEPEEKTLMEKLDDLYPLVQPKVPTKNGYKVMPPWSVPMPWNFDKQRDIYDDHATVSLHLQGMTTRIDWPTYTIRPALTRAQERRLEETSPDMEMDTLHTIGQQMLFACARLNDWVRHMDRTRQVIPLHRYLEQTALPDNPSRFGYNAMEHMVEGHREWRGDPPGYLECIRPSEEVEEETSSSSESNLWEEDCAWSDGDDGYQRDRLRLVRRR